LIRLPDPAAVAALMRDAAIAEILPRFRTLGAGDIREKGPGQLVTDADVLAEVMLARTLTALLPAAVVGEEAVAVDPGRLDALARPGPVWVIDPVDGTANFAKGDPRFAVIVALVVDGITAMGWIHDPLADHTVFAAAGGGAWCGDTRLGVLPEVPLAEMAGSAGRKAALAAGVASLGRRGSAAHDYLDLVEGRLHFAHFRKLMPWDHAAGVLIHAEAGGRGALLDGSPYRPAAGDGALLLAPGRDSWDALRALIG
jgi:fructose-1,6-bisphosphatase/inositol monophosphatase family enzyme